MATDGFGLLNTQLLPQACGEGGSGGHLLWLLKASENAFTRFCTCVLRSNWRCSCTGKLVNPSKNAELRGW